MTSCQNSVPSDKKTTVREESPSTVQQRQLSSRPSSSHLVKQPSDFMKHVTKNHVITEEMIEAKRIKMRPVNGQAFKVVHLQKA